MRVNLFFISLKFLLLRLPVFRAPLGVFRKTEANFRVFNDIKYLKSVRWEFCR
jgi:hypothetical protein